MIAGIEAAIPRSSQVVRVDSDEVPLFSEVLPLVPLGEGQPGVPVTIAPSIDSSGRGVYVSNICAPMGSKKSYHSRLHALNSGLKSITVVVAVRVSYALNALQEWCEAAQSDGNISLLSAWICGHSRMRKQLCPTLRRGLCRN